MKTTSEYLAEIKAATGKASDGAAGIALGWTRPATTAYKYNRSAFDNHTCLRVARALNIPIIQVIADMELQRERDPARRADWLPFATKTTNDTAPPDKPQPNHSTENAHQT